METWRRYLGEYIGASECINLDVVDTHRIGGACPGEGYQQRKEAPGLQIRKSYRKGSEGMWCWLRK